MRTLNCKIHVHIIMKSAGIFYHANRVFLQKAVLLKIGLVFFWVGSLYYKIRRYSLNVHENIQRCYLLTSK